MTALLKLKQVVYNGLKLLALVATPPLLIFYDLFCRHTWQLFGSKFTSRKELIILICAYVIFASIVIFYAFLAIKTIRQRKAHTTIFNRVLIYLCIAGIMPLCIIFCFRAGYELSPKRFFYSFDGTSYLSEYTFTRTGIYRNSDGIEGFMFDSYGIYTMQGTTFYLTMLYPPYFLTEKVDDWSYFKLKYANTGYNRLYYGINPDTKEKVAVHVSAEQSKLDIYNAADTLLFQ